MNVKLKEAVDRIRRGRAGEDVASIYPRKPGVPNKNWRVLAAADNAEIVDEYLRLLSGAATNDEWEWKSSSFSRRAMQTLNMLRCFPEDPQLWKTLREEADAKLLSMNHG